MFLQTMSQLALHRDDAWSRRAFDKLVWYLYMTGIKDGVTLRPEVVHDGEVARRDEEVADAHKDWDLLLQEERRQHRLRCDVELDVNKCESKEDRDC